MASLAALATLGLLVNRGVDFLRNAFDKHDRIPKAYWLLLSWGLGIGLAWAISNNHPVLALLHLPVNGAFGIALAGMGFGSVAGFWHELLSRWSGSPAATPKGLSPSTSE